MINFDNAQISRIVTHYIGNSMYEEDCRFSSGSQVLSNAEKTQLLNYFFNPLREREDLYAFAHSEGLEHNYVYGAVKEMLTDHDRFIPVSSGLGECLYNAVNEDARIRSGFLHVVSFDGILAGDEVVNAVGLFKSENDSVFVKISDEEQDFRLVLDQGFDLGKLDKAFLALGTEMESGMICMSYDRHVIANGAKYWNGDFLNLVRRENEFLYTTEVMKMTKEFVVDELAGNFSMEKADQIDLLNRSKSFFELNESYDSGQFADEVFDDPGVNDSFKAFEGRYKSETGVSWPENFELSNKAVERTSKVWKSILKLDKNFHVYIHGDRSMIERGRDADGRKFYKLYYDEEF